MDFEQNTNQPEPVDSEGSGHLPTAAIKNPTTKPAKKGAGWRIFMGIILALSILVNIALFLMLIGAVALFAAGPRDSLAEEVIRDGPRSKKIVMIKVEGIIDSLQAKSVYKQLKRIKNDSRVKGLIINVNSPGGTISGSDQIYNEIRRFREESGKPVVAFMQGMAASGGYYTSVACDKIVAEQTTITGSIGVIFGHFVLQELLENKLGIEPVIITSGPKKGWLSMFRPFGEEQQKYVEERLIDPAFERFVEVVDEGRPSLTLSEVKELADGGIYSAKEALKQNLIDDVGYLDKAIEVAKLLAGIQKAQVVEYHRPFSLAGFLSLRSKSKNILNFDRSMLYELSTPQLLYLWTGY
ncbi:MAG: signal peptide peptidase SppA [Planctomycetota bacterium]|jgi:protease-4